MGANEGVLQTMACTIGMDLSFLERSSKTLEGLHNELVIPGRQGYLCCHHLPSFTRLPGTIPYLHAYQSNVVDRLASLFLCVTYTYSAGSD